MIDFLSIKILNKLKDEIYMIKLIHSKISKRAK